VSSEVFGWPFFDCNFLGSRDFGSKLVCNFLRDFALDCESVIDVTIVLLSPNVRVGACVDQLRVHAQLATSALHTAFEDMRHAKRIANLMSVPGAAIGHHACPTDDF